MTPFESDPQYRERAAIWSMFSRLPLRSALSGGKIFRWFAINIPMDLGTGGTFTSDIDILASLWDYPATTNWFYKTWEVKVSIVHLNGTAKSLKLGKTNRTVTQLEAYRAFGSPDVSLLDLFICEPGLLSQKRGMPSPIINAVGHKLPFLCERRFGYQVLPFESRLEAGIEVATTVTDANTRMPSTIHYLPSLATHPTRDFLNLVQRLDYFFEQAGEVDHKSFKQIIFCRNCRQLHLIDMRRQIECPHCNDNLIQQS